MEEQGWLVAVWTERRYIPTAIVQFLRVHHPTRDLSLPRVTATLKLWGEQANTGPESPALFWGPQGPNDACLHHYLCSCRVVNSETPAIFFFFLNIKLGSASTVEQNMQGLEKRAEICFSLQGPI